MEEMQYFREMIKLTHATEKSLATVSFQGAFWSLLIRNRTLASIDI